MREDHIIFVVDDDLEDQSFFTMALERINMSFKCTFANNGLNALEKLNAEPDFIPDIIFMDINMPLMNGIECLSELKNIERLKHIPVYIYSTTCDENVIEKLTALGATEVLQKKTSIKDLKEMLCEVFTKHNVMTM